MNASATHFVNIWNIKVASDWEQYVAPTLAGGIAGAGLGGAVQLVRKLLQSRREEEENGSPSILNGILAGGLGGAGLGAGLQHLASTKDVGIPLRGAQAPVDLGTLVDRGPGNGPHAHRLPPINPLRQAIPPQDMMPISPTRSSIPMSTVM